MFILSEDRAEIINLALFDSITIIDDINGYSISALRNSELEIKSYEMPLSCGKYSEQEAYEILSEILKTISEEEKAYTMPKYRSQHKNTPGYTDVNDTLKNRTF